MVGQELCIYCDGNELKNDELKLIGGVLKDAITTLDSVAAKVQKRDVS